MLIHVLCLKIQILKDKYYVFDLQYNTIKMVKVIEGYILNQVIGEGNFGLVYRATHKEKPGVYAVKVIPIQKFQENDKLQIYTNNEIEALQAIGVSDYIIRFYEMIKSKNNWYLVYEFCNGGTLMNVLKRQQRLEEKKALIIFKQLLQAFKVLNKNNIMHRDLKPQNIFFTSMNQQQVQPNPNDKKKVKLGDFGFCKGLKPDQNLAKTMLGSPIYMAPQVLKGQSYTTKADIWSLGVILFEMLYGFCPFQSRSIASLINTIDTQPVQLPTNVQVSEKTQNLIRRMLSKDYFRRIGWVQLFGLRIDQNGQYLDQPVSSNQQRGNTPNKKVFTSLFGSLSIGVSSNLPNNRSYSTIRDDEQKNKVRFMSKKQIQDPKTLTQAQQRVSSQPKDQKRFYSQNYLNILSTPLQNKKKQQQQNKSSNDRKKLTLNLQPASSTTRQLIQNKNSSPHSATVPVTSSPPPPLVFRQQRLTSMDNIDMIRQQQNQAMSGLVGANNTSSINISSPVGSNIANGAGSGINNLLGSNIIGSMVIGTASGNPSTNTTTNGNGTNSQSIPFNKYRQNIGMASNLSSRLLSQRSIKQPSRTISLPNQSASSSSAPTQLQIKRSSLLKIHQIISKSLNKTMCILQQRINVYRISRDINDLSIVKDILQDCYIVLKIIQEKLKTINQSIKITETCLLDLATLVNHEHIQVEKFIIELRNQLIRCAMELPNMPSNLQLSKVDKMENINSFKELIKTKMIGQVVDDYF